MGIIYLVKPIGEYLRPIDKENRFITGERLPPPKVNCKNLKFGKWENDEKSLKKRFESRVGNVETRIVIQIDNKYLEEFETRLKNNCFSEYIKNYKNKTKRLTREWMLGIDINEAEKIILNEYEKFKYEKKVKQDPRTTITQSYVHEY